MQPEILYLNSTKVIYFYNANIIVISPKLFTDDMLNWSGVSGGTGSHDDL